MSQTWLITGATAGLGRHVADRALARGAHVIAVGRRGDLLQQLADDAPAGARVTQVPLDITSPAAESTVRTAIEAAGGLDVLVNNAAYGLFGAVEQITDAQARAVIETNLFGNLAVLRAALPALRGSKGRIVQLSTLIAQYAWASSGVYSASKAAIELIAEALSLELAPHGVRVTIVEPGLVGTDFGATAQILPPDETYASTVGAFLAGYAELPPSAFTDPARVADVIEAVTAMDEPPLRLAVGPDAVQGIRDALKARTAEFERWEAFSTM
jgi:NAD(P)-dependent dehydrogenase (short-subunit alcohol dehydrogenase family)